MEFHFFTTYLVLFALAGGQILFAGYLKQKYRKSYLDMFFYLVLANVFLGIVDLIVRYFLPHVLETGSEQNLRISMIFGFVVVPGMIVFLYIFIIFLLSLLKKEARKWFKVLYFSVWAIFFFGFILAEISFFTKNSMELTIILQQFFDIGMIVFGLGICSYVLIKQSSIIDRDFRSMTLFVTLYYVGIYIIGMSFFTSFLPSLLDRLYSYFYVMLFNLPPMTLFYFHLRREKEILPAVEEGFEQILAKYNISKREKDIIRLILHGMSNREIQDSLYISLRTVESHIYRIYGKLGIKNRIQLINLFK